MKLSRTRIALLAAAAVLLGGWGLFHRYWYYIPGLLMTWRDPIGTNRPVVWEQGPARPAPGGRPPNVIVILADDLGWNDLTFNHGGVAGGAMPTPHIDAIGKEGATFWQAYAGDNTCAPSRAAIMTGRYATRFGFEFTPAPKAFMKLLSTYATPEGVPSYYHAERERDFPDSIADMTVPASEVMIGQLMKTRGYHTVMLGKWHLGGTPASAPEHRGFDEALAFYDGASLFLPEHDPLAENSYQDFDPVDKFEWANLPFAIRYNGGPRFAPDEYMTDYLGREAVRAIEANRNRPFFMYLAFNAVHSPLQALKSDYDALSDIKDHRLRVYAAMIRALDRDVGRVMDALKANGLDDNTLVLFTSDNGGANYIGLPDINKPFRGWKATFFEGGIHVPFFLRWPGKIAPGTTFDKPVGHVDIFATAAAAAAVPVPDDRVIDGTDLVAHLTGAAAGDPHETLYWRNGDTKVLLGGGWKLQTAVHPHKTWLFDLTTDPTEQHDLAASRPDKVESLGKILSGIDSVQAKPLWPSLLEVPLAVDHPLGVPRRPGEEYVYWAN